MEEPQETNINDFILSRKIMVTTTIPIKIKEWVDFKKMDVNRLIEMGFRSFVDQKRINQRIKELDERIVQMEKSINLYDKRVREMYAKFCDIKEKYKIIEEI